MTEPDMYPLVDVPDFTEEYESFEELRENAEQMLGSLNYPLSWFLFDEYHEDWGSFGSFEREFSLCVALPRKAKYTVWTTHVFEHVEVQRWLDSFVKDKIMEWYGW